MLPRCKGGAVFDPFEVLFFMSLKMAVMVTQQLKQLSGQNLTSRTTRLI